MTSSVYRSPRPSSAATHNNRATDPLLTAPRGWPTGDDARKPCGAEHTSMERRWCSAEHRKRGVRWVNLTRAMTSLPLRWRSLIGSMWESCGSEVTTQPPRSHHGQQGQGRKKHQNSCFQEPERKTSGEARQEGREVRLEHALAALPSHREPASPPEDREPGGAYAACRLAPPGPTTRSAFVRGVAAPGTRSATPTLRVSALRCWPFRIVPCFLHLLRARTRGGLDGLR